MRPPLSAFLLIVVERGIFPKITSPKPASPKKCEIALPLSSLLSRLSILVLTCRHFNTIREQYLLLSVRRGLLTLQVLDQHFSHAMLLHINQQRPVTLESNVGGGGGHSVAKLKWRKNRASVSADGLRICAFRVGCFCAAETNARHLRGLSKRLLAKVCALRRTLPHHLGYRRHSNRDVTSQHLPMKACVA